MHLNVVFVWVQAIASTDMCLLLLLRGGPGWSSGFLFSLIAAWWGANANVKKQGSRAARARTGKLSSGETRTVIRCNIKDNTGRLSGRREVGSSPASPGDARATEAGPSYFFGEG